MNFRRTASQLFDQASSVLEKKTGYKLPSKVRIQPDPNPLEGFALGLVGANIGLLAMTLYQNYAAKPIFEASPEADKNPSGSLDSISVVGKQHEDDESSTAAVGRKALETVTGEGPKNDAMATALSYGVHWGFGMLMGGAYGALRSGKGGAADLGVGLAFGAGLWALADEVVVPHTGPAGGADQGVEDPARQSPGGSPALRCRAGDRDAGDHPHLAERPFGRLRQLLELRRSGDGRSRLRQRQVAESFRIW